MVLIGPPTLTETVAALLPVDRQRRVLLTLSVTAAESLACEAAMDSGLGRHVLGRHHACFLNALAQQREQPTWVRRRSQGRWQ
jgi:hypothetical protein